MVLQISRPHRHPRTGVYYFRQKTPADLRARFGKSEAYWSLKTKDPAVAKVLHAEAARRQALVWESLRAEPAAIPHKKLVALSGVFHRELVSMIECEPGETKSWRTMLHKFAPAKAHGVAVERAFGDEADRLLQEAGLAADAHSRTRL